jgi:hypothetical protein
VCRAVTGSPCGTAERVRERQHPDVAPAPMGKQASRSKLARRSLWTTRERPSGRVPATATAGEKRAHTGARARTSLARPKRRPADPSPTETPIRGRAPCEKTTGRHVSPQRNPAVRNRRPGGRRHGRPQPAARARSSPARRPDRLAVYMGYCPHRQKGPVSCGTRDGHTLSRRRRRDRYACSSSRTGVWRRWGEAFACRPNRA